MIPELCPTSGAITHLCPAPGPRAPPGRHRTSWWCPHGGSSHSRIWCLLLHAISQRRSAGWTQVQEQHGQLGQKNITSQEAQDPSCSNGSLFPAIIITTTSNISITTATIPYPPIAMIITTTYTIQTNIFSITILFITLTIVNINTVTVITIIIKIISRETVTTISVFIDTTTVTVISSSSSSPSLSWLLIECLQCITYCHKGFT